eukprot:6423023-Amphidinium_carterae.1
MQYDLSDAFNSISREDVWAGLNQVSPELARSQHGWLTRPAFAYIQSTANRREVCSTLLGSLKRFRALQSRDGIECWDDQYVDDGVIECARSDIDRTYANLEAALGPSGLRLNASKSHIWTPTGPVANAGPANVQGLTLCGKPIWEDGNSERAVPVGVTNHIDTFLKAHTDNFQQRLVALRTLIEHSPDDSTATHVAVHILRCSLLAKHTHLIRYLPRPVCHTWASQLDDQVLVFLQRTLHLGELTEHQRDILSLPVRDGGFGISQLVKERVFHHAGAILALQSCKPWYNTPDGEWAPPAQAAMDDASEVLGQPISAALGVSAATLVRHGTVKATTKLRRLYYDRIGATICASSPDHAPPLAPCLGATRHRSCERSVWCPGSPAATHQMAHLVDHHGHQQCAPAHIHP